MQGGKNDMGKRGFAAGEGNKWKSGTELRRGPEEIEIVLLSMLLSILLLLSAVATRQEMTDSMEVHTVTQCRVLTGRWITRKHVCNRHTMYECQKDHEPPRKYKSNHC